MFVDFSESDNNAVSFCCALHSVYLLNATLEYHIYHEPMHHDHVLVYTFGGAGTLIYKERQVELTEGSLLLFDAGYGEFEYYTTQPEWSFWWFEFRGDDFPLEEDLVYDIQLDNHMLGTISKIFMLHKQNQYELAAAVFCGMSAELAYLVQSRGENYYKKLLLYRLQEYIQQNLPTVNVQSLAQYAQMSSKSVSTLFRDYCGQSPKEYITSVKMQSAQYFLRATPQSVAQIAETLGYSSAFHFSKAFKQFTCVSPREYRR